MDLPANVEDALNRVVPALSASLGENLYSCILYGSANRGELLSRFSDINLLLVFRESTPQVHVAIAEILRNERRVSPFVLGLVGLERSLRAFAIKFRSIRRNYRLLCGVDFLADWSVDEELVRFLCEQSLRNLRLRATHAFITFGHDRRRYSRYLIETVPALFTELSEAVRCGGTEISADRAARIPVMQQAWNGDVSILSDLLALKQNPRTLSDAEIADFHARLFGLISRALQWMETRWPNPIPGKIG